MRQNDKRTTRPPIKSSGSELELFFLNAQLLQMRGNIGTMGRGVDLLDHFKNLLVNTNDECCTTRKIAIVDAIGRGNFSVRITKDRVV